MNYNGKIKIWEYDYQTYYNYMEFYNLPNLEKINFPQLRFIASPSYPTIFKDLPKLKEIKIREIIGHNIGDNTYHPFALNLPSLKDIYTELLQYGLTDWEENNLHPFVSNVSSNAVLHFLSENTLAGTIKTIIRKFKYYYGFKTITFEKPEY